MGNCISAITDNFETYNTIINDQKAINDTITATLISTDPNVSTVLPLRPLDSYVILSDLHLGNGDVKTDESLKSMPILLRFLNELCFVQTTTKLILLGDVEELWEYSLDEIAPPHRDEIYHLFRILAAQQRLYKVLGNHDWELKNLSGHDADVYRTLLPICQMTESITLVRNPDEKIVLIHGHQGNFDASATSTKCAEFCVDKCWSTVKQIPSPVESITVRNAAENVYSKWAFDHKTFLIMGHTHHAMFDDQNMSYMNSGSTSSDAERIDLIRLDYNGAYLERYSLLGDERCATANFETVYAYLQNNNEFRPLHLELETTE